MRPEPIPLILVTGFYGAGKSTLLDALGRGGTCPNALILKTEAAARFASPSLTLASGHAGCLCCSGRGDWASLLERLLRERDNHRMPPFDRLIVETTGEADPVAMLGAVIGHPYLSLRFRVAGNVAVVDAACWADTQRRFPQSRQQIAVADWIVINDHSGMPPLILPDLAMMAPAARILPWAQALTSGDLWSGILDSTALLRTDSTRRQVYRAALSSRAGPQGSHHQTDIRHVRFDTPSVLALSELAPFLHGFAEAFRDHILRISGTATIRERPGVVLAINVVQGRVAPLQPVADGAAPPPGLALTIVVHDMPAEQISAYCKEYVTACT